MQNTSATKRIGEVEVLFRDLITALADRYRVISPDTPTRRFLELSGSGP